MRLVLRKILILALAGVFVAGVQAPGFSFAVEGYEEDGYYYEDDGYYYDEDTSDDYDYRDENGEIIDGEDETYGLQKDTTWFDSFNPKKEYTLYSEEELIGFASLVNKKQKDRWKENPYETFEGVTIKLGRDIKLTQDWVPVGSDERICFKGTFDGNGHVIRGINIESNDLNVGFFGYLSGEVRNLTVKGKIKSKNGPCGSIAGTLSPEGSITDCKSQVALSGKAKAGGIAGYNEGGRIIKCINNGDVRGTKNAGGIVGVNTGTVRKCGNTGEVRTSVRGSTSYGTGGVAGKSLSPDGPVDKCFNTGNIYSCTEATGGVVGYANVRGTTVKNSYNTGNISVNNSKSSDRSIKGYAGGVIGIAGVKGVVVKNCYNAGNITNSDWTGGIIGQYDQNLIEDEDREGNDEGCIRNNYYVSTSAGKGIGQYYKGDSVYKSVNMSGTKRTGSSSLMNMGERLGSAYENKMEDAIASDSYPALKWQDGNEHINDEADLNRDMLRNITVDRELLEAGAPDNSVVMRIFNWRKYMAASASKREKHPEDYLKEAMKHYKNPYDVEKPEKHSLVETHPVSEWQERLQYAEKHKKAILGETIFSRDLSQPDYNKKATAIKAFNPNRTIADSVSEMKKIKEKEDE